MINNNISKKFELNTKIKKYTIKEKENLTSSKIIIAKNIKDIKLFVKNELLKKTSNSKIYLGKINDITANRIKNSTGLYLKNYNISLKGDNVRKIIKDHGNKTLENLRGQEAITPKDFEYIDDIILDADYIFLSEKTKHGKNVITFEKKINNKYTLVEFISSKRKNIETHTMFKRKKKNSVTVGNNSKFLP